MRNYKTLTLSLIVSVITVGLIAVALHSGRSYAATEKKTVKVLRKKEQLAVKPTAQEIASVPLDSAQDSAEEERRFENTIPEHVPLKVKLKNEQAFKNMKNKNWAREMEIEIKNTGTKPIYYLYMLIVMPDVTVGGYPYAMQIHYGRKELVRLYTPIQPDDTPIRPGEMVTLKVTEKQVKGYEESRDKENRNDPKRVKFDMQLINFGDGTGLRGTDGRPSPNPAKKQSSHASYAQEEINASPPLTGVQENGSCYQFAKSSDAFQPANFTRVNFSLADKVSTPVSASDSSDLCDCQNTFNCFFGTLEYATCPCDDPEAYIAFIPTSCSDALSNCSQTQTVTQTCNTQYNGTQYCQYQAEGASCSKTGPTPSPTPGGTPPPSPWPTPATQCAEDCARCNPNGYCETKSCPSQLLSV